MTFVNYFHQIGGFDAMVKLFREGTEATEKLPFEMISYLTSPFRCIKEVT